jgi:hypothetical protein
MAATVIAEYGVELNQGPLSNPQAYSPLRPNQLGGRVRFAIFTWASTTEATESIALTRIPKGARILDIQVAVSVTLGSAQLSFGLCGADGDGYMDDGTGADTSGNQVADSVTFIKAAATYTSANTKVALVTPAPANYMTNFLNGGAGSVGPTAEGVMNPTNGPWMYMTAKDVYLTATVSAAAMSNQVVQGYVLYIVD